MSNMLTWLRLKQIFLFPFMGENWQQKFLVAFLLVSAYFIIPVIPLVFLLGYGFSIINRIIQEYPEQAILPEWGSFGKLFKNGIKICILSVLLIIFFLILFSLVFGMVFVVSYGISFLFTEPKDLGVLAYILSAITTIGGILMVGGAILFSILPIFLFLSSTSHMAAKDKFMAAFKFREWLPILRNNVSGYFLSGLFMWGIAFVSGTVLLLLQFAPGFCFIFPLFFSLWFTYVFLVGCALFAYAYRDGYQRYIQDNPELFISEGKYKNIQLETESFYLRRFSQKYLKTFVEYRNHPSVSRYQDWESYSDAEGLEFIKKQQKINPGDIGESFVFAIVEKGTDQLVGDLSITIDGEFSSNLEIGLTLSPFYQHKGLGYEVNIPVLNFVFDELGIHRVYAITDSKNIAAHKQLERMGFRREAHFVEYAWAKENWVDVYYFALLKEEWKEKLDSLLIYLAEKKNKEKDSQT